MLPKEKQMEVLEAFDLTKSYRAAGQLVGVDHHTVARAVAARALGQSEAGQAPPPTVAEAFCDKITEWIERSGGRVRADVVHDKLVDMGYTGSPRTTRRVVSALKDTHRVGNHRIYKPWITEPGMWLQYDFGSGPVIAGVKVVLFIAWLAWSRFRVIIPLGDRSLPSVIGALDETFRLIDGVPTYLLTDNEKTVTDYHLCGIAVRNATAVDVSRYYGVSIVTCVPFDPESKGGSESSVKLAKADLVPTEYNLFEEHSSFSALEVACTELMAELNGRPHSVTRRCPAELLEVERTKLHPVPDLRLHRRLRGVTVDRLVLGRVVPGSPLLGAPHPGRWPGLGPGCRRRGGDRGRGGIHCHRGGPPRPGGGRTGLDQRRALPRRSNHPLDRAPRATKESEASFLALGEGATRYLVEAAAVGTRRLEKKMAEAVTLAALHGVDVVDRALGIAAIAGRFAEGDLESIIVHASGETRGAAVPPAEHSLASGTAGWSGFGATEEVAS